MRNRPVLSFAALSLIALGAVGGAAYVGTGLLEDRGQAQVAAALTDGDAWLTASVDGTRLTLTGQAPDFATRTASLRRIGAASDGLAMSDLTTARDATSTPATDAPADTATAASLQLEILRDGPAYTLFGTIPRGQPTADLLADLSPGADTPDADLTSLVATTPGQGAAPWIDALRLGLEAVDLFDQARVVITPGAVTLTASTPDQAASDTARDRLSAMVPDGIAFSIDIVVPRPVLSPYLFTAQRPAIGALRVPVCMAQTEQGAALLTEAAAAQGTRPECQIGLGAPSADWEQAVIASLDTLDTLGAGSLQIRNADIMLTGTRDTDAVLFDTQATALKSALPPGFSLTALLPPGEEVDEAEQAPPPRFTAVRTEDGAVRIRGDLIDDVLRETAETFAEAKFGFDTVINETRARADLPAGWSARVVGGLEGLGLLATGQLEVTDSQVFLTGTYVDEGTEETLRQVLASRLPEDSDTLLEVWRDEDLAVGPVVAVPADLCAEQISLLLQATQILFPPGKTDIEADSLPVIDRIAEILRTCPGARFEIGGHTDSQGREESNLAISTARATTVLNALTSRNLDMVFLYAKGYGETKPIGDNETEEGRAINRRIAFKLVTAEEQARATAPKDPIETLLVAPSPPSGDQIGAAAAQDGSTVTWPPPTQVPWPAALSRVSPDGEQRPPLLRDGTAPTAPPGALPRLRAPQTPAPTSTAEDLLVRLPEDVFRPRSRPAGLVDVSTPDDPEPDSPSATGSAAAAPETASPDASEGN